MAAVNTLTVTILSPLEIVWQGNAVSLSSENSEGPFDILPDHARFMSLIELVPITIYEQDGSEQTFTFKSAVLFFQDNQAKIYVHQAA